MAVNEADKRRANRLRVARERADDRVVKPGLTAVEIEALAKLRPWGKAADRGRTEFEGGWHSSQKLKIGRGRER